MCEFLSAVKAQDKRGNDKWYYLTHRLIHDTPRGKLLQKKYGGDELIGHSAIREYFGIREGQGENWECTDFSTPENFPPVLVEAIKKGEFRGTTAPVGLLTRQAQDKQEEAEQPALAEYEKVRQLASAEYKKAEQPAWEEYEKVRQLAWAEYNKAEQLAGAEHEKVRQAWAEHEEAEQLAWAEHKKVEQQALAEYERVRQPALAEYEKVRQQAFWDLFADPENRTKAWQ